MIQLGRRYSRRELSSLPCYGCGAVVDRRDMNPLCRLCSCDWVIRFVKCSYGRVVERIHRMNQTGWMLTGVTNRHQRDLLTVTVGLPGCQVTPVGQMTLERFRRLTEEMSLLG